MERWYSPSGRFYHERGPRAGSRIFAAPSGTRYPVKVTTAQARADGQWLVKLAKQFEDANIA